MNLVLLVPAALAGLAALLLPLLLHLARRSERTPTDFAALAWLAARARPRRHVRFDEWLLLLVRLALIATLVLLLARPAITGAPAPVPWVVALPGVPAETLRDHQAPADAQRRWLAPGFPTLDVPAPAGVQPVASLLRELDAALPAAAPLTVLVPTVIDAADAERPRLSRRVTWRVVDTPGATAVRSAPDARTRSSAPMPTLVVRHRDDRLPQVRYLRAAALAWQAGDAQAATHRAAGNGPSAVTPESPDTNDGTAAAPDPVGDAPPAAVGGPARDDDVRPDAGRVDIAELGRPLPAQARLLAWLAPGAVPTPVREWVAAGGTLLLDAEAVLPSAASPMPSVAWRSDDGRVLLDARALGRGRVLQWAQPLLPMALPGLLEPDFPNQLRAAIEAPRPAPDRADTHHYVPTAGATPWPLQPRELAQWLAVLAALLFVLERWLANGARARPADGMAAATAPRSA